MAITNFPWFPIYADETASDENFVTWTVAERGVWFTLLIHCWKEGSIPSDIERLARLCGCTAPAMHEHWTSIASRFQPHPSTAGRLISPRMEMEREKSLAKAHSLSDKARNAANTRWGKGKETMLKHNSSNAQAMLDECPLPLPLPKKDVPPTPLKGDRKRRTRTEIMGAFSEDVCFVANTVMENGFWFEKDPGGRPIVQDLAKLCSNLDSIFREFPEVSKETLVKAAENYLAKDRQAYRAPQWFYGTGTKDKPADWAVEVRMIQHQASRAAEVSALALAQGEN